MWIWDVKEVLLPLEVLDLIVTIDPEIDPAAPLEVKKKMLLEMLI
jgi:hypothetical protein